MTAGRATAHAVARVALVSLAVALALLGTFLLAATPSVMDGPGARVLWALFALVLLKVPLLGIVWWLISRRRRRAAPAAGRAEADALALRVAALEAATPPPPGEVAALRADALAAAGAADGALGGELVALAMRADRLGRRPSR
ncbi:hypothetical protein [Miltoncostaea marina]|uniref:hypothetical protein n=1 Tax=Miltoncostaea marina TaxID=2843215 RepID=UPI001C3D9FF1|nr:hypothetical protein [Miltoncostaea marina]